MSDLKKYYMECICSSNEHRLVFTLDPEEEYPELWLDIFLNDTVWYKRWWKGLKYALGYKCKYGHFGNWSIDPKDIPKMREMLSEFKKACKNSKLRRNDD